MHASDEQAPLWSIVRVLEHDEVEAWRKKHHPSLTQEGAFAEYVTEIHTEVKRRPQGNIWVTVSVLARRAFECETNAYRLQRQGKHYYKVLQPDELSTSE